MSSFSYHPSRKKNLANGMLTTLSEENTRRRDIFIPMESDAGRNVTDIFALGDEGFPEGGQSTLYEYAGIHIDIGANSKIHRELDNQSLQKGYVLTLLKLARSIDLCEYHTHAHGPRTSILCRFLAREMGFGLAEVEQIALAGMLHDVGKVVVPKEILMKPGRLTEDEWKIMRRHPTFAAMIMEPCAELRQVIPAVQAHHEYFDGTGYPENRAGNQIPITARILTLADAFTTMIEGRIYQPIFSVPETLEEVKRCTNRQFDPRVVRALMSLIARGEIDDILFWRNWRNNLPFSSQ